MDGNPDGTGLAGFGRLLRYHRLAAGLTQEGLAARAMVSVRNIRYMERGVEHAPQRDTVRLLADALALPAHDRAAFAAAAEQWGTRPRSRLTAATGTHPHTLPAVLSPLFGRASDAATIQDILYREDARLVTLTGPAGVGKTRLALHVAAAVARQYPDGVFLVALASARDPSLVMPAIARALDVRDNGARPLDARVRAHLRSRRVLLLLDNVEQIPAAAPLIVDLLTACPEVGALVTSRAPLQVRGEQEYRLSPLAIPDPARLPPVDELAQCPAVALFLRQARAVNPAFALTTANAATVVEICRQLDGLPLAIELAAARVTVLPPHQLLSRLGRRLRVLTDGARDLPERQQTLRKALDWSYDLLTTREQRVLRQLCVFAGGCSLEAAEVVCDVDNEWDAGDAGDASTLPDALDVLASLVNKSLVHPVRHDRAGWDIEQEARFDVLETVREYGRERSDACGDADTLARRHASYVLTLCEGAEGHLIGPRQEDWVALLEREHDNVRAALRWARTGHAYGLGLRLAAALWRFWWMHGHLSEGRDWLDDLLALDAAHAVPDTAASVAVRIKALKGAGILATQQGDFARAVVLHEESLALARREGAGEDIASALNNLGNVAFRQGDYARAVALHEESLALARALGDTPGMGRALNNLGNVALFRGEYERATTLYEQSLALARELGDTWSAGAGLNNLGIVARNRGDYAHATALYEQSLALQRELGERQGIARALANLAELAQDLGDDTRAMTLCTESLAMRRLVGDRWGIASALAMLGDIARGEGDDATAYTRYAEGLIMQRELGDTLEMARCLEGMAAAARGVGQPDYAGLLFGTAAALREEIGAPLPAADRVRHERDVEATRATLGDDRFAVVWAEGHALSPDRVVPLARHITTTVVSERQ